MGLLVDGRWQDRWYDTAKTGGAFQRSESRFRSWPRQPRPARPAEPGRYRLYVSLACPWAHRTLILRALKGLRRMVAVASCTGSWASGWTFEPGPGVVPDPDGAALPARGLHPRRPGHHLPRHRPGPVGHPDRHDRQQRERRHHPHVQRRLRRLRRQPGDFYPEPLRPEIDALNARIYDTVNNGVYKAGFATTQAPTRPR